MMRSITCAPIPRNRITRRTWRMCRSAARKFSAEWRPAAGQQVKLSLTALTGSRSALNGKQDLYVFNYPSQNAIAEWNGRWKSGLVVHERLRVVNRLGSGVYPVMDSSFAYERWHVHPYCADDEPDERVLRGDCGGAAAGARVCGWVGVSAKQAVECLGVLWKRMRCLMKRDKVGHPELWRSQLTEITSPVWLRIDAP